MKSPSRVALSMNSAKTIASIFYVVLVVGCVGVNETNKEAASSPSMLEIISDDIVEAFIPDTIDLFGLYRTSDYPFGLNAPLLVPWGYNANRTIFVWEQIECDGGCGCCSDRLIVIDTEKGNVVEDVQLCNGETEVYNLDKTLHRKDIDALMKKYGIIPARIDFIPNQGKKQEMTMSDGENLFIASNIDSIASSQCEFQSGITYESAFLMGTKRGKILEMVGPLVRSEECLAEGYRIIGYVNAPEYAEAQNIVIVASGLRGFEGEVDVDLKFSVVENSFSAKSIGYRVSEENLQIIDLKTNYIIDSILLPEEIDGKELVFHTKDKAIIDNRLMIDFKTREFTSIPYLPGEIALRMDSSGLSAIQSECFGLDTFPSEDRVTPDSKDMKGASDVKWFATDYDPDTKVKTQLFNVSHLVGSYLWDIHMSAVIVKHHFELRKGRWQSISSDTLVYEFSEGESTNRYASSRDVSVYSKYSVNHFDCDTKSGVTVGCNEELNIRLDCDYLEMHCNVLRVYRVVNEEKKYVTLEGTPENMIDLSDTECYICTDKFYGSINAETGEWVYKIEGDCPMTLSVEN
jgi:hypothetical protein